MIKFLQFDKVFDNWWWYDLCYTCYKIAGGEGYFHENEINATLRSTKVLMMILTMLILIVDSIFQGDWWWPRAKTSEEDDCEVILFVFGFFVCDSVIMILCLFAILVWCLGFVLSCHWIFLCGSGHVYFKYLHFQQLFVNEPKLF